MARLFGRYGGNRVLPNSGVKGFDVVLSNLQKQIIQIKGGTRRGLILSAAHIRVDSDSTPPVTPVDKGNLRASWFTVATGGGTVNDPLGKSGVFKNNKAAGIKAGQMAAQHKTMTSAMQASVNSVKDAISVGMGYSANYALRVHENLGANFKREGAGPKWFESAVKRNADIILKIIAENAQIK